MLGEDCKDGKVEEEEEAAEAGGQRNLSGKNDLGTVFQRYTEEVFVKNGC